MAVDYCWCELTQRMGWVPSAYLQKGATSQPEHVRTGCNLTESAIGGLR